MLINKKDQSKWILLFSVLVIIAGLFLEKDNIYIGYIKLFKKSALIEHFDNNGQKDGEVLGYTDGNLEISTFYVNGYRDGLTEQYYKNGKIENVFYFKHGKREGTELKYYENGQLEYSEVWKNNKYYGSAYHYSTDGKLTDYVEMGIDYLLFYMKYDKSGLSTIYFGHSFSKELFSYDTKTDSTEVLRNNQTYQNINDLNITVATPPNLIPKINLSINNKPITNLKIVENTIKVKNAFASKGVYYIKVLGELVNPKNVRIRADTLDINITKN